jgi:hypothetical protein
MANSPTQQPREPKRPVAVYVDQQVEVQPATFNLCPLGVQFYSPKPLAEFALLELDVDVTNASGQPSKITCQGAVVRCQREPEPNRYRIWVKFIDMPEGAMECIRCSSKDGQHLCTYCENF